MSLTKVSYSMINGAPVNVMDFGADATGNTDSTAAIQAACNALTNDSILVFPEGGTIKIDGNVVITASNVTLDFCNCVLTSSITSSIPLFSFIPQSLVTSGRLTGADYPSSWKNGSTPLPIDNDFDTMMYENVDNLRIKNITIKSARISSDCTRTFTKIYSVDGVSFEDCIIEPSTYSAARLYHCSDIRAGRENKFGGSGTYTMFLFKCRKYSISSTFTSQTSIRALSAKGVMHEDGQSIFSNFATTSTYYRYFNSVFSGVVANGIDGVFWDTTPNYNEDAVGARGGTPIGFTSGSWFGQGYGLNVKNAIFSLTDATPGTNGNQAGRAVWASAPHKSVFIDNNDFFDSTVFLAGIENFSIDNNSFRYDRGVGYAWEVQGDTVTGTDGSQFSINGNKVFNWQPIGTTTSATRIGTSNGYFVNNNLHLPVNGTVGFVAWANNYSGVCDQISVENNRIFYNAGSPILGTFGTNNPNGYRSNNVLFNSTSGAYTTDGYRTADIGAAGYGVFASDDSTGYAGITFYNKAGTAAKGQYYWDAASDTLSWYVGTNTRLRLSDQSLYPNFDNNASCGKFGNRWSVVYAATGTINTSDENAKTDIRPLDYKEKAVALAIKARIKAFKFKDAVEKKGDDARIHFGVIAQDVKEAFEAEGLDATKYGVFCSDVLEDGSERLGVRYDELLAFIVAVS